jgi:hypothetical protein
MSLMIGRGPGPLGHSGPLKPLVIVIFVPADPVSPLLSAPAPIKHVQRQVILVIAVLLAVFERLRDAL